MAEVIGWGPGVQGFKDFTVICCSNLMAAVSLLAPPPSVGHASTVLEWLGLLDLLELEGKFLGYSLKKISILWDIELTSVSLLPRGCGFTI